jgi:hypothetical protein
MPAKKSEAKDERVKIPLPPEAALRALLKVDPDDPPADDKDKLRPPRGTKSKG